MKTTALAIACLWAAWALSACAQYPPPKAAQPGEAAAGPAATQPAPGALPPGHPDISAMMKDKSQPAPGGAGGGMPGMGRLPAGHPDISKMRAQPGGPAMAGGTGALSIKAIQGTPGGPSPTGDEVIVEFYHQGAAIDKITRKLDPQGIAIIDNVLLTVALQPVVTIMHAGVEYRAIGQPMSSEHPRQDLQVMVYETTEQEPQWNIRMRHLIVHNGADGLHVTEMLAIESPADRSWLGRKTEDGKRQSLVLPLPANAQNVRPSMGFHECCTKIDKGMVISTTAVTPGISQYQLDYVIPLSQGSARIAVAAPAAVKHFMVFLPDDGSKVEAEGLESAGTTSQGQHGKTRFYKAMNQLPGQIASVSLSGVKAPTAPGEPRSPAPAGTSQIAQIVAGAGGVLILLVIVALLFVRAPRNAAKHAE